MVRYKYFVSYHFSKGGSTGFGRAPVILDDAKFITSMEQIRAMENYLEGQDLGHTIIVLNYHFLCEISDITS